MIKGRKKKSKSRVKWIITANLLAACFISSVVVVAMWIKKNENLIKPDVLLSAYMDHITKKEYEKMYQMIDLARSKNISLADFSARNSKIYEGIEMRNIKIQILSVEKGKKGIVAVAYQTKFDTAAGEVQFDNKADFIEEENKYALIWEDSLIHPDLESGDKVRVITSQAERGYIFDRNGTILAGQGTASSVGIIPGKRKENQTALQEIALLLQMDAAAIEKKLGAGWVKEDTFVPLKTIPKVLEIDLLRNEPDEKILKEKERQDQLLNISGVLITDVEVREYPLKEAAAHLVGYVQNVTAEDLKELEGKDYNSNSVIGKNGMEGLFEKKLKGRNGCEIYIADGDGNKKTLLASIPKQDGQDVQLTIDAEIQTQLYNQFQKDKSCTVAMNPYTGEVLAMVSTPSFDNNDFIRGISDDIWKLLNDNADKPLYNRFRQLWCPGSVLKPVIGAIGLKTGAIDPNEDYGSEGLSWRKDASWGDYYVTTLHDYKPVVLENALIYSDNIYFAKAALKIGEKDLTAEFGQLGFNQEPPFEIKLKKSQYSNTDTIESEVQLADSGYGQAQILMNPIHLASIYTSFINNGNMIKPYLIYSKKAKKEIWIPNAFPGDAADLILEGMKKVVNDPNGSGYSANRKDVMLAGKTGTAEIKASKEDTSGTELGWFAVFTADRKTHRPILVVSMAEDVKGIGGSGYVVKKVKRVLDSYLDAE